MTDPLKESYISNAAIFCNAASRSHCPRSDRQWKIAAAFAAKSANAVTTESANPVTAALDEESAEQFDQGITIRRE
jgi:hypothetical protein